MNLAHMQLLIEGMIDSIWLVEPVGLHIIAANQSACQLLLCDADDIVDKNVIDLVVSPEDLFFWEDVASGLSNKIFSETQLQRSDGKIVHVRRRVYLLKIDGEPALFVVSMRDHSQQKQIEGELEKLIAELRATLESTADGILVTSLEGGIRCYNQRFAQLWNLPDHLLTQRDDAAIYAWMDRSMIDSSGYGQRMDAISKSHLMEATDRLVLKSGNILERVTLPQYARGKPIGRVYSYRDITQRLTDEARLTLAARVFSSSPDAIFITDPEQRIVTANPGFEALTGFLEKEVVGTPVRHFLNERRTSSKVSEMLAQIEQQGSWEGELWGLHKDGGSYVCAASIVRVQDENGATIHYIGFFKDTTETHLANQKIEQMAFTDGLTGLPNRLLLNERIKQTIQLANRQHKRFALLFLDLDHFKQINDSLGHPFGDRVLIEVAERLKKCIRQVDMAARLGGDEFVLLLHEAETSGAEICARRVLDMLRSPIMLDGMHFTITCSIGVAVYPDDGQDMDNLIKNADSAMYHAKERGRADFRFYQRQMNIGLLSRMKLEQAMRQALENGGFRLHYQPLVDLRSNRVFGAEALLRWRDKELGEVSPAQFIPIAEETGVIVAIGQWVMGSAIRQAAEWNRDGQFLRVSINVSALQFQQSDFVATLDAMLHEANLSPDRIELELTESILIKDAQEALKRLESLVTLGVRIAIDDFGTGYSSLSYLKRFPIHKLKIDRSFVMNLPNDESDIAIATAIIRLAQSLKLRVIAEGVETDAQRDFLHSLGCDELQGYLFAPALAVTEFEQRFLYAEDLPLMRQELF